MARWRVALAALALVAAGCSDETSGTAGQGRAASGRAGELVKKSIAAMGGWERWMALRDFSYISTLTIFDPARQILSERVGWFRAPLHKGALARMDSIGLSSAVQFGIDAGDTWLLRDGAMVEDPGQLAISRFELVSSLFWFSLPFALVEMPAQLTDLGEETGQDGQSWHRVKAVFETRNPGVPGNWFVLYFDSSSWRIDRVHAHLRAPFLRHELWIVQWRQYEQHDGLWIERERRFYPADISGRIVGPLVAQQLVEHLKLNPGEADRSFRRPGAVEHAAAAPAGGRRLSPGSYERRDTPS